ncbi:RNA-directed DNA polymerase, eukaryota, reverse transcriptase zinc-binding domain protein [Tanacetum coccineum]
MHFEINFINDHRKQFVSFVYAKNSEKDRKPLWKNLADHCLVVNNEPWVVLGDFNVTLNVDESSNSFGVIDKDMDVFRKVLFDLCLDDIISYGMFYTWTQKRMNPSSGILRKLDRVLGNPSFLTSYDSCFAKFLPYMTSDHCPALIVYPDIKSTKPKSFRFMNFLADKPEFLTTVKNNWGIEVNGFRMFVLTKRLKNMKRYMRNLNRVNGNVFDKVKVLRVELKRVQTSLDKEPDNIHLREEEYVYCKAYKEAMCDEEKVLRQKTKIQWLKDGDQNSAYFHNSLKGRIFKSRIEEVYDAQGNKYVGDTIASKFVEHFQNFLGFKDEVFPIEDLDGLFIKKLDSQCADSMVRPVLDDEIKHAMFSSDVCAAVKEFFASSKLLGEFNANLISLVPKLKTPLKITDYRPIACGNVVYKCISKVIFNRLKEGLGSIIDCNQSAFIPRRQISDNILLAQEFVNGYSCKGGALKCAFKVDIEKAYDTVSWEFLKTALIKFGFHASMIKWIMVCLTTASFSICINGAVHGFFKGKRGLRQGDPMSPRIKLTYLCFADDLLMLCHGDLISASILRRALDEFSRGFFPVRYLRILDWRNKSLSLAGKLQLIASVLSSLHVYWACMFILPVFVCDSIDKLLKNFVWSKDDSGKGIASVAWKDVCRPKEQRGLGLKYVRVMNHALMVKHLWNIASKKDSLWVKWLNVYRIKGEPSRWKDRLKDVLDVPVPVLDHDRDDMALWFNKHNEEVRFSVKEAWRVLRTDVPKVLWCKHVWFSQCIPRHSFILWMAIKGRLKTQDRISRWFNAVNMLCPFCKKEKDSHSHLFFDCDFAQGVWNRLKVMSRLDVFPVLFWGSMRSAEMVTSMIIDTVRLRLLGLNIKHSCEVVKAVVIWNLPRKAILGDGARSTFGSSIFFGIVDISIGMTSSFFRPYACDHPVVITMSDWVGNGEVGWVGLGYLIWVGVIRECRVDFSSVAVLMHRYGSATYSSSGYGVLGIWGSSFFGKGLGSVSRFMGYGLDCVSLYCDHFKGSGSGLWKCNTIFIIDKGLWMDCIVFWSSGFMVSMVIWHQGILSLMIQWAYIHGKLPLLTSKGSGYGKTSSSMVNYDSVDYSSAWSIMSVVHMFSIRISGSSFGSLCLVSNQVFVNYKYKDNAEFAYRGYEDSASKYKRSKKDFKWSS